MTSFAQSRYDDRAMAGSLRGWLYIVAVAGLLELAIIGLDPFTIKPLQPTTGAGDMSRQIGYSLIFLATLIGTPRWTVRQLFVIPATLCLLLAWCWLSLSWAIEPGIALRRLMLTTMIIWSIFKAVDTLGYERTMVVVRIGLAVALVLNFLSIALVPTSIHTMNEIGDPGLIGDWRGLLQHKNFAGAVCAFTILVYLFDCRRIAMPLRLAVILATSYFLYRTGSKTSMGVLVAAIGIGAIYSLYNPRYRALLLPGAMLAVASAILWIYLHIDQIVAPLYSQTALTGRVQIWAVQIGYAQDHPLLGAGYGSFWNIGETSPVYQYGRGWVRDLASGHNGYLDLLAQIGFPGLILALLAVFILPAARLFTSQTVRRSRGAMLLAMIVFGAGHNLTEASLMDRDTIVQLFLMFAVALVGVACSSRRLPGQIAMRAT